jgi:hypothetical protein
MKISETLNFMGEDFCNNLKNTFTSNIFPWYYNNHVVGESNEGTEFFFTHIIFNHIEKKVNSERTFELIRPLLDKLNLSIEKLIRIKMNFYTNQGKFIKHDFHTDFNEPHTTFIYSLNTTDGYFELEDGTRSLDIADKLIEFDGLIPHRGTTTTNQFYRMNMVINYEK